MLYADNFDSVLMCSDNDSANHGVETGRVTPAGQDSNVLQFHTRFPFD